MEAASLDAELAAAAADRPVEHRERLSEWTPERDLLAQVYDRLGDLMGIIIAVNGNRPPEIERHPRPESAAQRVREKATRRKHEQLVQRLVRRAGD